MARPRGASKPTTRSARRPENLASLSSEVLRLSLQALNLPIDGSKTQLTKRLRAAIQGVQHGQSEDRRPTGRVQKRKTRAPAVRSRPVERTANTNKPDSDVDDHDELSSVRSLDIYEDSPNIAPDVDTLEDGLEQPSAPFTAAQLATIRETVTETVQLSLAEALSQRPSVPEPSQPFQGLGVASSSPPFRRPGSANPLGLHKTLDKGTEDKILRGEYIDFTSLLPDTLTRPQVPELQFRFDDSGPGSTSNMTMVRKRKPVIDSFHKWLDAYTTYMIVLVSAYPRRSLELLKYQQAISCAATKFKGLSWLTYDEQFRRRAANDLTINWGQVDLELWTVTFSGLAKPHCLICSSPYHSQTDCPSADSSRQQIRNGAVCFRFNRTSGCSSTSCQFPHVCRRCHSASHSVINCPRSLSRKHNNQRSQGSSTGDRSKR